MTVGNVQLPNISRDAKQSGGGGLMLVCTWEMARI